MKKILTILLLTLSATSYAQNKEDILKEINGVASYHATILGYASFCKLPQNKIDLFRYQFIGIINNLNLSEVDYKFINKNFLDTLSIATQKGPSNSKMTCPEFSTEFEKIYQAINAGKINQ